MHCIAMIPTIFVNIGKIPNPSKGLLSEAGSQEKVLGLHSSQLTSPGFTHQLFSRLNQRFLLGFVIGLELCHVTSARLQRNLPRNVHDVNLNKYSTDKEEQIGQSEKSTGTQHEEKMPKSVTFSCAGGTTEG